ncbi:unnamed protein product [Timema podura]|uniref:Maturase K n=1 Tax=Timema podura TaxID=61482 RepID=A0ABN7NFS0_TIMPD|nr:unnamed protein product [Timema podura]
MREPSCCETSIRRFMFLFIARINFDYVIRLQNEGYSLHLSQQLPRYRSRSPGIDFRRFQNVSVKQWVCNGVELSLFDGFLSHLFRERERERERWTSVSSPPFSHYTSPKDAGEAGDV